MAGWREFVAVAAGAVVGTGLRLSLDAAIPHEDSGFPLSTLIINTVGTFALGALVSTVWRRPGTPAWVKAGLGPGLLGTFTTFSAVVTSLLAEGALGLGDTLLLYLVLTLVLGFAAAAVGLSLGRRRRPTRPAPTR